MVDAVIPQDKEWQECRNTIGRLDTTLADFRKYSFSIVTVLITASGFFTQQAASADAKAAVSSAIMLLIASLSTVDRLYVVVQSAAVERALDIEQTSGQKIDRKDLSKNRLTQVITARYLLAGAAYVVPVLYTALVLTTGVLAVGMLNQLPLLVARVRAISLLVIWGFTGWTEIWARTGLFREGRRQ